jgi:hypothetical protein
VQRVKRAARRDRVERHLIDAFEALGAWTLTLNQEQRPDLLIGYRGRLALVEVKSHPRAVLTGKQLAFHRLLKELGLPCYLVRSVDEAIIALRDLGKRTGNP